MSSKPPRSNIIAVANKLLDPYMMRRWSAAKHTAAFDQTIDIPDYGYGDELDRLTVEINNNYIALEYFKTLGIVDFTAERNKGNGRVIWWIHITAADHDKFFDFLEQEKLQLVGNDIVERSILSPVEQHVGNDFCIHTNGSISYKGNLLQLQAGQAKVAAALLSASVNGQWITSDSLLTRTGSARITKVISEINTIFRATTQSPNHNYFPNDRMLGYTFKPL